MVTNLTEGYAVVTGVVGGVQLHGSSGARSSRLLMRGRSSMGAGFMFMLRHTESSPAEEVSDTLNINLVS